MNILMEFWGSSVIESANWLICWIMKGIGLYLILWALGISRHLIIEQTTTDFEGDGSPMEAPAIIPEITICHESTTHELRRVV